MSRIGIAALAALAAVAWPAPARASCIAQTLEEQLDRADIVFVGVALEGPTATGIQRFRVERYVKGAGSDVVRVETGVVVNPDGTGSITSVSVDAAAGDRWRIYATERDGVLETSVCAGSTELAGEAGGAQAQPPGPDDAGASGFDRRAVFGAASVAGLLALSAVLVAARRRRV